MHLVELDEADLTVRFARPGVQLDLGSVGKGYAIGRAGELLRQAGLTRALLHGGTSTVLAMGTPPNAEAWRVALEHPLLATGTPPNSKLETRNSGGLTAIGRQMLRLPMHPRYSRMFVEAGRRDCVPSAALCAALVSGRDLLMRVPRGDARATETRELFEASQDSDFFTLMRAYQFAKKNGFNPETCRRYGITDDRTPVRCRLGFRKRAVDRLHHCSCVHLPLIDRLVCAFRANTWRPICREQEEWHPGFGRFVCGGMEVGGRSA